MNYYTVVSWQNNQYIPASRTYRNRDLAFARCNKLNATRIGIPYAVLIRFV